MSSRLLQSIGWVWVWMALRYLTSTLLLKLPVGPNCRLLSRPITPRMVKRGNKNCQFVLLWLTLAK